MSRRGVSAKTGSPLRPNSEPRVSLSLAKFSGVNAAGWIAVSGTRNESVRVRKNLAKCSRETDENSRLNSINPSDANSLEAGFCNFCQLPRDTPLSRFRYLSVSNQRNTLYIIIIILDTMPCDNSPVSYGVHSLQVTSIL